MIGGGGAMSLILSPNIICPLPTPSECCPLTIGLVVVSICTDNWSQGTAGKKPKRLQSIHGI